MKETTNLLAEIKLLLQEELADVRTSIHKIEVQMTEIKGNSIKRTEFAHSLEVEQQKHEIITNKFNKLDKQVTELRTTTKIYIAIASTIAGLFGSGVGAFFLKVVL